MNSGQVLKLNFNSCFPNIHFPFPCGMQHFVKVSETFWLWEEICAFATKYYCCAPNGQNLRANIEICEYFGHTTSSFVWTLKLTIDPDLKLKHLTLNPVKIKSFWSIQLLTKTLQFSIHIKVEIDKWWTGASDLTQNCR